MGWALIDQARQICAARHECEGCPLEIPDGPPLRSAGVRKTCVAADGDGRIPVDGAYEGPEDFACALALVRIGASKG
jgi:hypothetical protein